MNGAPKYQQSNLMLKVPKVGLNLGPSKQNDYEADALTILLQLLRLQIQHFEAWAAQGTIISSVAY